MRKHRAIISIGAGNSQLPLILSSRKRGWSVVAVDRNPNAIGFQHTDMSINESTYDSDTVIAALREIQDLYQFEGVVARTTAYEALLTAAKVAQEFNLPGLTNELVQISTEKSTLREFCNLYFLPVPMGIKGGPDISHIELVNPPLIIKPDRTSVGKSNIYFCSNKSHLHTYIAETIKMSTNQMVEIESYLEGIDATCLCWAHRGQAQIITWWDELVGIDKDNRIVGLGVSVPSVIAGTIVQGEAERIVAKLVRHFPEADVLLHVSFRVTMEGMPYIMEVHADLGGDLIADVLLPSANKNFNFFDIAILIATKQLQKVEDYFFNPTVLYYMNRSNELGSASFLQFFDPALYQEGGVKHNLALLPEIVPLRNIELSAWPLHLEWFEKNSSGVYE